MACIVCMMAIFVNAEHASAVELYNNNGLLEVLKKNQVLSERDMIDIKSEYPRLEVKGSLQLQYIYVAADSAADKVNEIDIRRLNLTLLAHLSDKVSLIIEPEYGKGQPSIRDAYITYRLPFFGIYAGNHRVPFSAEALQNDINLRFVERNLTSQISPDRLVGVSVFRSLVNNRITVQAGIWSTNLNIKAEEDLINNNLADNQIFATTSGASGGNILINAARIGYSSTGRDDFYARGKGLSEDENYNNERSVGFGLSYYNSGSATSEHTSTGLTGLNGAKAYEADLSVRFWRIAGEVEYANRTLDWWQYNPVSTSEEVTSKQKSYSVQASVLLTQQIAFGLRQELFKYDGSEKVLKGAYGQDQDSWLTAGLTYYMKDKNSKIQANYIWKKEDMPSGVEEPDNDTALVQVTSSF